MHRIKTCRATIALVLALALAGCAGAMFSEPKVSLDNVRIGGLGLTGGTLLVGLQIQNPNRFSLNANQLRYELALSDPQRGGDTTWIDFARGTYDQPFSVPARDSAQVQIPVEFSYSGLGSAGASILRRGTFSYRATGSVDVRTRLGTHAVPFRKRGTITLMGTR